MKKLIIAACVASSVLLSGCAAVIQGPAALKARNASEHPANKSFVVSTSKNNAFNASMKSLTAKDRKITSSDREAGVIQGSIDGDDVTINIANKGAKESTIAITVTYSKPFSYGPTHLEEELNTLVTEINDAVTNSSLNASAAAVNDVVDAPVVVKKSKSKRK